MDSDRQAKIRSRAHEVWEREGRPDNRQDLHWAQAEREIDNEEANGAKSPDHLVVTEYNDPSRRGGPVEGGPYPEGAAQAPIRHAEPTVADEGRMTRKAAPTKSRR